MKILEPIEINGMKLKNRIAFAPFFNMPAGEDGEVVDLTIKWFEERAKGGVGFIMAGTLSVVPVPEFAKPILKEMTTPLSRLLWGLGEDTFIPDFQRITDVVHSYDVKIGAQLALATVDPGVLLAGKGSAIPSAPPYPNDRDQIEDPWDLSVGQSRYNLSKIFKNALQVEEIKEYIQLCGDAAARAKEAGFDCVQLHSAHTSAAHSAFISPYYNKRTDEYGGDWEGRLRFTCESIKAMRKAVGDNFPIIVRINSEEFCGSYGVTLKESCDIVVPAMEEAGADCIDVSQGNLMQTGDQIFMPVYFKKGQFIDYCAEMKRSTKLPVIGVGKIVDMEMAEKFLQEEKADIIYMGRQLCSDPATPKKYFEGRPEDIRKCIGCQPFGTDGSRCGRPCSINYDLCDEALPIEPTEEPKKVMIVGGGVGGMEAARIAALRGHKVTLVEKEAELGGMVGLLALNPIMTSFKNIVDYLTVQMKKLEIDVRVCREATEQDVEELNPDVVILATGASLTMPKITEGKIGMMSHTEALKRKEDIGNKVVIWGFPAAEYAIALAQEGRDVTLIGGGKKSLVSGLPFFRKFWVARKLGDMNYLREHKDLKKEENVKVLYNVKVEDITSAGIKITNDEIGEKVLPYDSFIVSRGRKSNDGLFNKLQGKVKEVYKIGDCFKVKDIKEAVWKANEVARKI